MDQATSFRRLRHRERRLLRRFEILVPVAFVAGATLLSAGVIKVMELPRRAVAEPPRVTRSVAPAPDPVPLSAGKLDPGVSAAIGVSLLEDEVEDSPETPAAAGSPPDAYSSIPISSTSNRSAAPGGIDDCCGGVSP